MLLTNDLPDWGIQVTRVDADKPETWQQHVKPNTKVNTLLQISPGVHCILLINSCIWSANCLVMHAA